MRRVVCVYCMCGPCAKAESQIDWLISKIWCAGTVSSRKGSA